MLSRIVDWDDRTTCILFGDGAGAVVLERVGEGGFLGFDLGADGSGGSQLYIPAGGSRAPATAETVAARQHYVRMNGREVFKFATRVLVDSAERVLDECGVAVDEVDVYVPHQANVRIIDHARRSSGSRKSEPSSTLTVSATPRPARFRSRSPTRRPTGGSRRASSC